MSNVFQNVLSDAQGVEQKLLGPDYPYWKNINSPSAIGMSSNGSLSALGSDINGLIAYVEVLVSGSGNASATGGPLGNRFFLNTGGQCNANPDASGNPMLADRYIFIDNVPSGNIPFISSGMGVDFSEFKGLIPGAMSNLNVLNPFEIMQSFMEGSTPQCQKITMQTVGPTPPPTSLPVNAQGTETQYVSLTDISNMDPCSFPNGQNPVTKKTCNEGFKTMRKRRSYPTSLSHFSHSIPKDRFLQMYFVSLGVLAIYVLYCLTIRAKGR